jgi:AAA ATPase domain
MITSLRLKNFKSFSDSTLPLSAISLVFGANAVGKSNFFDALRFMKYMGEGRSIRDAIEGHTSFGPAGTTVTGIRGGAPEITRLGSQSTQFELTVSMHTRGGDVQYNICVDASKYRVVQEEVTSKKHPGPYVFTTHPEPGPLIQEEDSPVLYARFYKGTRGLNPRRGFSPNESILSQFKGRAAESRLNEDAAQLVREELASIQPLELRPEVLRQYSALGRFQLGEHGENFAAVVWDLVTDARWAAENPDHVDDVPEAKAALDR